MISFDEVRHLNRSGNVIPVFERLPADLDTPVSAYIKLAGGRPDSFLLESIEGGEKLARYSFIGFDPFMIIEAGTGTVSISQGGQHRTIEAEPIEFLKELFDVYRPIRVEGLPRFTGGAVGYFSYDSVRWIENIPDNNPDRIGLAQMRFGLFSRIVAFDHIRQEIVVIANILHDQGERGLKRKYDEARASIGKIIGKLESGRVRIPVERSRAGAARSNCTRKTFASMVRRAKRYIKEGDVFQVVLSQRWTIASKRSALTVYRRLRRLNPSPYMFLLKMGPDAIVGSSPEMMVRIEGSTIEVRPIAGTRPRGKNEQADRKLSRELLADEKERAEHTMLLDLGRNDVGRVSLPGTVVVKENMKIEKYSHVIHIVSSVAGKLRRKSSAIDGHFACFPAGTVSGAPKVRAMEIIDELESERRSVYAGSIAYLDFWGNLDSCIAIRTAVKRGDKYFVQAGAGIVADSRPTREYEETIAKASVLIEAIRGND